MGILSHRPLTPDHSTHSRDKQATPRHVEQGRTEPLWRGSQLSNGFFRYPKDAALYCPPWAACTWRRRTLHVLLLPLPELQRHGTTFLQHAQHAADEQHGDTGAAYAVAMGRPGCASRASLRICLVFTAHVPWLLEASVRVRADAAPATLRRASLKFHVGVMIRGHRCCLWRFLVGDGRC